MMITNGPYKFSNLLLFKPYIHHGPEFDKKAIEEKILFKNYYFALYSQTNKNLQFETNIQGIISKSFNNNKTQISRQWLKTY